MLSEALVPLENSGKQVRQPAVLNMNGVAWHWPFCCRHSGRVGCRAVAQSMATGSAAGSRVVVSVPHRCRPMPGRGNAESIAAKAAPTRASHALCEPRLPRCPGFCGKRTSLRRLALLQQPPRPYAPVFCGSGFGRDALLAGLCTGVGPSHASIPTAARKCAHKGASCFCGSGLGRDALILVQRPGRLRTQALPQLCCCRCRGAGLYLGRAQRRWRIHAYSGSPASTSTTPQSRASPPTPITA